MRTLLTLITALLFCPGYGMFIQVVSVIPESCGNSNESVFVQVGGGVSPYSFSWSNGATTQNLSGIPGGTYTLSVTDDVGTPVSDQVVVPSIGACRHIPMCGTRGPPR